MKWAVIVLFALSGCVSKTMLQHEVGEAYARGEKAGTEKVVEICNEEMQRTRDRVKECESKLYRCYEADKDK